MDNSKLKKYSWLVVLWLFTVVGALQMIDAGYGKFEHLEGWKIWFAKWGYPAGFSIVIGVLEMGVALFVLIPKLSSYASLVLIAILLGAFFTLLFNESDLSLIDPWFGIAILLVPLFGRWKQRWRPGLKSATE